MINRYFLSLTEMRLWLARMYPFRAPHGVEINIKKKRSKEISEEYESPFPLSCVLASVNLCQYMSTHGVSDWCYCPDIVNIWLHNVQRESREIASLQQRHSTTILNFQQLRFDEWCWNTFIKNLCSQLKSLKTVMVALHSSISTQNLPFPTNCKVLSSS